MSLFNIGISALNAASAALNTTSQNISNVNTTGYHRKVIAQSAINGVSQSYGFTGNGVQVDDVRRVYDQYLDKQVQSATTASNYFTTQYGYLSQLDNVIGNSTNGLAPRMQDFFAALQGLTSNPASLPSRQAVIDKSSSLVNTFKSVGDSLETIRQGINTEVKSSVTTINGLANQIATLNDQIAKMWSANGQHLPNDLIDQRDQAVTELNKYITASTVPLSDGTVNVFIGSGQSLVLGNQPMALVAQASTANAAELVVAYQAGGAELPSQLLTGGSLGGALASRTTLDQSMVQLGSVVTSLTTAFNAQHAQGVDKNGDPGSNQFFKLDFDFPEFNTAFTAVGGNPATFNPSNLTALTPAQLDVVNSYAIRALSLGVTSADKLAAASGYVASSAAGNTGTAAVSAVSVDAIASASNTAAGGGMTLPMTLTWNGAATPPGFTAPAGYSITSLPGVTGGYQLIDTGTGKATGLEFTLNGTPATGDAFTLAQRPAGPMSDTGDNANLLQLIGLQTANIAGGGSATLQGAYGQLSTYIGSKTNEVKVMMSAQEAVLKEATVARENVSGVNLDEEAANLLRFQQAYQAASKVIQINNTLFDSVLSAFN